LSARETHVSAESTRRRSSWLTRLWIAAALLLIVGGGLTVLYNLALISNPITQQISPGLEESARMEVAAGALQDFNL
jgi:hypothetical protein